MTTLLLSHPACEKHDIPGHPESPKRIRGIFEALQKDNLLPQLEQVSAPEVNKEHILRVHTREHYQEVIDSAPSEGYATLDPDTHMNPFTLEAALRAAGAVVEATEMVLTGKASNAFCAVRPPGHHAEHDRVMGFCFFNNIAIGAAYAMAVHHLQRVAIVDFDVHHGNGTEDIFFKEPGVLICSSYQSPFYPFTGCQTIPGHIINIPFAAGTDGQAFLNTVADPWYDALIAFQPEIIFISAGFDAHKDDPLAGMRLDEEDYYVITKRMQAAADICCHGRLISSLEGGYNVKALGRSVSAHIRALVESSV